MAKISIYFELAKKRVGKVQIIMKTTWKTTWRTVFSVATFYDTFLTDRHWRIMSLFDINRW